MVNKRNVCFYCTNWYASAYSLNRHIKEKHFRTCSFKCLEGCNLAFDESSELVSHLESVHYIDPEEEEYIFDDIGEFNEWLNELEDTLGYKYVKSQDIKSKFKTSIFSCYKDGTEEPAMVLLGCTSQIKLTQEQGKCLVTYFKAHYGHSMEPQHLREANDVNLKVESQQANDKPIESKLKENGASNNDRSKRKILTRKKENKEHPEILNVRKSISKTIFQGNKEYPKTSTVRKRISKTIPQGNKEYPETSNVRKRISKTIPQGNKEYPEISNVRKSISKTTFQDDSVTIKEEISDAEESYKIETKNDVTSTPPCPLEDTVHNIQIEILKLKENIDYETNIKVLSHVLETLTNVNEFMAASNASYTSE